MSGGYYDADGKCVHCGDFHPCLCEVENQRFEQDNALVEAEEIFWEGE